MKRDELSKRGYQRLVVAPRLGSFLTKRPGALVDGGAEPILNNAPAPPLPELFDCPNANGAFVVAGDAGNPETLPAGDAG